MTWAYKILDLPAVPQHFQDLVKSTNYRSVGSLVSASHYKKHKTVNGARQNRRELINGNGLPNIAFPRYHVNHEFDLWVSENIMNNSSEIGVSVSGDEGGNLGPHTDRRRDHVLMFVVEPGGENCRTVFWQETGQALIRNRFTYIDDYSKLTQLDEVCATPQQWILLNSRIIHSVENINSGQRRINFHISLPRDETTLARLVCKELVK